ncbi:MAG: nucleotide pyrophosphohydrolase [Silvanigrellaceae bacterium]|nr:nucleotide pyrophosphohydrolase [Silvanigrellaceae bacterium]
MENQDKKITIQELKVIMNEFVTERDWKKFHTPQSLAMNLSVEAGELLEKFVWADKQGSFQELEKNRQEIEDELADVFMCVLSFCNVANIDLSKAMLAKLEEVKAKYPVDKVKGKSTKYDKL